MKSKPLPYRSEWTTELIEQYDRAIGKVARRFELDCYPHLLEIITAEQMMDAYASVGMPVNYHHWSFGKHFLATESSYKRGQMGLAYEIVINSDPCVAYLMEENTMTMQALVIAHAAYGHNSFFKGNYLFRTWTAADAIVDYLVFARNFIAECEERHGEAEVEELLDACHALRNFGVDRYKRPRQLSMIKERERQKEREAYLQSQVNELWRTLPVRRREREDAKQQQRFPRDPEDNLLYFIEKNAPLLEPWQREIVRIVRKLSQYFLPQRQTQLMNEGWACFWHYTLLNQLYDDDLLEDGFMFEFLHAHTSVVMQTAYNAPYYNGVNPYALGFAMWRDIRRICSAPTAEDRDWFPDLAGSDWRSAIDFAMRNFKDESFIAQYLSPKLMREFHLFAVTDDDSQERINVDAIHDTDGYRALRQALSEQTNLGSNEPTIQVCHVALQEDRALTLRYLQRQRRPLADTLDDVLRHVATLWGFPVRMEEQDEFGNISVIRKTRIERHSSQRAAS